MLATKLFDYDLPEKFIARYPAPTRDGSRMMVVDRETGDIEIHPFADILNFLNPGDALICNNTKVLRGRMFAKKEGRDDGAAFEILLLEPASGEQNEWNCMLKPGKRAKEGTWAVLQYPDGRINPDGEKFTVIGRNEDDTFRIRFSTDDISSLEERYGHIPLPPYLHREAEADDSERYQTVYAAVKGAVAAPTAGLHFTPEILDAARKKGVHIGELTLHVGAGTFKPVSSEYAETHQMHYEDFVLPENTASLINQTRKNGGKVLAIGTTTVRVLESCCDENGFAVAQSGRTNIFLYPPRKPKGEDMLLTNFHLPCSTLLMLVSCFAGREKILAAYERAKAENMRFYSYGDCMLLK
ncbi:MAG: tRNA preQ1(34) S-adenosylmethionine ribosyltransferase-isomerase QueA [Lentisphaeria bacterium]|nr:tRNA preQ1(34) S-adenosylmethionine ribosyltransferase-isomerase QueA [Lentisphaeria bacterium]